MDLPAVGRLANHRLRASRYLLRRSSQTHYLIFCEDHVGSNDPVISINGRGGIRTHAGVSPHDFQSCALSHSATRPRPFVPRKGTDHPFSGGSGMDLGMDLACARSSRETTLSTHFAPYPSLDQKPLRDLLRRAPSKTLPSFPKRGFEPHCRTASFLQRREWDSNPRGVATNALAGRRHKPLGHPSKRRSRSPEIAPLGIEPRLSGTRIRRVANYTTGHQEPPVGFEPTTPSLRVTCSTN